MIKNSLLTLFISSISLASFAQVPTLTGPNVCPALNDSFALITCNTSGIYQGSAGASQTWDFSATLVDTTVADSLSIGTVVYATAGTGYSILGLAAAAIPSSTFATSNFAVESPAISSSPATYYIENASKWSTTGIFIDNSDFWLYSDPLDVFQFPFTYMSTFSDTYAGVLSYSGATLPAVETGSENVTGDAYGTLILPPVPPSSTPTTYTGVLRVHGFELFRDSANIFGAPFIQTDTIETYTWYQPGYHTGLLTITTVSGGLAVYKKTVSYARRQIANHEAVPSLDLNNTLLVYPNPATYNLNIRYSTLGSNHVRISMLDMAGREVSLISDAQGAQNISYNVSSLPKGLYMLHLQSADQSVSRKIEIQ